MKSAVKPRSYQAPLRERHAAATRTQILAAAVKVFTARGYPATRIADVAQEAGVATPTVYKVFRTKGALLVAAVEASMAGDDSMTVIQAQPWWQDQLKADPQTQLRLIARNARAIYDRAGRLLEVVRAAAASDAAIADLWRVINDQRLERSELTARSLQEKGALKPGLSLRETAITLWTLSALELYSLIVDQGGLRSLGYEDWLAGALSAVLLRTRTE